MDLHLRGKRAVVTGASKGIGRGVARALAAEGVDVVVAARSEAQLSAEADQIAADFGVSATAVPCDLSTPAGRAALVEVIDGGPLDIVVNNAGAIPGGSLDEVDDQAWREGWDLKVFGYVNLTRALLPRLIEQGSGVVLNVIGSAADRPNAGYIAGAAGNSALVGFTKAIGAESIRSGVRALAVNPGLIVTDRMTDLLRRRAESEYGDPNRWEEMIPTDPAAGTVEQVADVVAFLVSDRASHVNAVALTIDGGAAAR